MNNYRKISFDIDFAGKKVLNTIQMPLEELTQNDFNSSLLTLKLMQGQELINLQGLSVVLNFLMPSGKDYVDTINAEMIDIENSIVSYSIPKDILSEVGMVVGTVSLYKEGYRYTSIVQFKFEVVSDFVEDGEIVESDNYPILAQMIGEVQNLKDEEIKRVESEIERIENEEERESSELQREMNEVERHEAENVRIINEQNREVKELERDQAERLREANSAKVKREEETRLEAETLRVQAESLRVGAESDRIQAESIRQMQESDRHEKELERQAAENLRVLAEIEREQKQNEFNARAEEVAVRIEEESQRISDLVEIEESKLVKPNDMVDYMGNQHNSLKAKSDSDVDYAVKTAIGEFNYLDYEGQHITATNSIEGHARSAILKGQTLVNKLKSGFGTNPIGISTATKAKYTLLTKLEEGKVYTISFDLEGVEGSDTLNVGFGWGWAEPITASNGRHTIKFPKERVTTEPTFIAFYFHHGTTSANVKNVVVVEGSFDDIPYFEGMASVKMPVLKTVGKNLFHIDGQEIFSDNNLHQIQNDEVIMENTTYGYYNCAIKYFNLKPNGIYTISYDSEILSGAPHERVIVLDDQKVTLNDNNGTFTAPLNGKVRINFYSGSANQIGKIRYYNIQIEEGSSATAYEPFKSNILSAPSDLELRGIGEGSNRVEDELDCLTGEVVERIGEIVLDGSENWLHEPTYTNENVYGCLILFNELSQRPKPNNFNFANNMFPNITTSSYQSEGFATNPAVLSLRIAKDKLESVDLNGFKKYLQNHPVTLQYPLATESIKTVDLSDNVVYSYNGTTHYSCSSEEGSLVPTLSVKAPTDVQEVISEQRKIISEQEEAQNILIDSQLSLYESIGGIQTLQTNGEEVQMPQYIIDLYELAYKRGIRKKGER